MSEKVFTPGPQDLPDGVTFTVDNVDVVGSNSDPFFVACVKELTEKLNNSFEELSEKLTAEYVVQDDEFYAARCRLFQFFGQDDNLGAVRRLLFAPGEDVFTERDALYAVFFSFVMPPMSVKKFLDHPATVKDDAGVVPFESLVVINDFSRRLHQEGMLLRSDRIALFAQHLTFDDYQELAYGKVKASVIEKLLNEGFRGSETVKFLALNLPDEWSEEI